MEFLILFLLVSAVLGHPEPQLVIPGVGQSVVPTLPVATHTQVLATPSAPSVVQFLKQPSGVLTGVVGQPALGQVVATPETQFSQVAALNALAQQQLISSGLLPIAPMNNGYLNAVTLQGLGGVNGFGVAGLTGLPMPLSYASGLTLANANGVPVYLSGVNGIPSIPSMTLPPTAINPQPVVNMNPVIRQVPEVDESGVVQLDSMDAALLDMEKKGQMHMEKYAWGRSAANVKRPRPEANREQRAELPLYYTVPSGIVTTPTEVLSNSPLFVPAKPTRTVNPFEGLTGKRKKHFELYQYV